MDIKLLHRFNEVAALMKALEALGEQNPLRNDEVFTTLEKRGYLRVPRIVSVTPPETPEQFADADFSPEAIQKRAQEGERQTLKALQLTLHQLGRCCRTALSRSVSRITEGKVLKEFHLSRVVTFPKKTA